MTGLHCDRILWWCSLKSYFTLIMQPKGNVRCFWKHFKLNESVKCKQMMLSQSISHNPGASMFSTAPDTQRHTETRPTWWEIGVTALQRSHRNPCPVLDRGGSLCLSLSLSCGNSPTPPHRCGNKEKKEILVLNIFHYWQNFFSVQKVRTITKVFILFLNLGKKISRPCSSKMIVSTWGNVF